MLRNTHKLYKDCSIHYLTAIIIAVNYLKHPAINTNFSSIIARLSKDYKEISHFAVYLRIQNNHNIVVFSHKVKN